MAKKTKGGGVKGTEDIMRRKQEKLMGLELSLLRHPSKADLQTNLFFRIYKWNG